MRLGSLLQREQHLSHHGEVAVLVQEERRQRAERARAPLVEDAQAGDEPTTTCRAGFAVRGDPNPIGRRLRRGGNPTRRTTALISPTRPIETAEHLLERTPELDALGDALRTVKATRRGRLVVVGGEAGIGKTALVQAFCLNIASARVLAGACEALQTARPLGPLVDIASETGGELEWLVERGSGPVDVLAALLSELRRRPPNVVVIEDLNRADGATLDLVRLLARRIETAPALVVITYRDDEVGRTDPLRRVLGELPRTSVTRLQLEPLSRAAVDDLARPLRGRLRRASPGHRRQPVLRHRGTCGGRDRASRERARRRARPGGAPARRRPGAARRRGDHPAAGGALAARGDRGGRARVRRGGPDVGDAARPPRRHRLPPRDRAGGHRGDDAARPPPRASRAVPCARSQVRPAGRTSRALRTTPRRPATSRRCSSSRLPQPSVRPTSARTASRLRSSRAPSASPTGSPARSGRTCSSAARTSAT